MTALTIAPSIRSSNAIQIKTKAINEGTDIIIAITVPLTMISRFVKLFFLSDKIEPKNKTGLLYSYRFCQIFRIVRINFSFDGKIIGY